MTSKKSGSGRKGTGSRGEKAAPQKPPQRKWLHIGGVFFVAVWMFVLGILVGRGTAPVKFDIEKIQKDLAALKAATLQRSKPEVAASSGRGPSTGGIDPADLEFYEGLRASRRELNFKPSSKEEVRRKASKQTSKPGKKQSAAASVDKKSTAKAVKPEAVKTVTQETRSSPAASPVRRQVTIQVASVKSQQTAERMVRGLKKKGYPAYVRIGKVPGKGIWYRVRVGRFVSRKEAAGMLARLHKNNWEAVIVGR